MVSLPHNPQQIRQGQLSISFIMSSWPVSRAIRRDTVPTASAGAGARAGAASRGRRARQRRAIEGRATSRAAAARASGTVEGDPTDHPATDRPTPQAWGPLGGAFNSVFAFVRGHFRREVCLEIGSGKILGEILGKRAGIGLDENGHLAFFL